MIKLLKLFHNNLPIRATKTGGFSISLNEVNSESSTEFRDIDAVWAERELRSFFLSER